ncbi:16S rRNA (guanine(966)-N(2))-methyltransferase RsmD [Agilicoccus flavus]|uniref:16S rRNA (guanine(966)-N(2))-methyltransferase RsmD n=1 Tax=Agilicoccus flavus TaxID=2775968 RepID=UPI001CF6C38C|nr:16S rRNA (guanine(966)-N(2))-methyltransferase RsmD [Agilicoccus flavus]
MTRIIAGTAGGRRIDTPPGAATRPTSDRVREALFSRLGHLDVLAGARVLDLYAGSGALGLEALSRGAADAVLVESARPAALVARRNVAALGLPARVVADTAERALAGSAARGPFDLVLLDPPYDVDEPTLAGVLGALVEPGRLDPDAVVVVERSTRSPEPAWPRGLRAFADRAYGETTLWYAEPDPDDPQELP